MTWVSYLLIAIGLFGLGFIYGFLETMIPRFRSVSILKEKGGVISENPIWVACDRHEPYLYLADTYLQLLWLLFREWRHDKHLAGG